MPSLSQMRDMYRIQRDAKRVRKELKNIHVEAEADGVRVVVTGEQEIVTIDVPDTVPNARVGALVKDALNRALKKAQVVASEKMQPIMNQMGIPTEAAQ